MLSTSMLTRRLPANHILLCILYITQVRGNVPIYPVYGCDGQYLLGGIFPSCYYNEHPNSLYDSLSKKYCLPAGQEYVMLEKSDQLPLYCLNQCQYKYCNCPHCNGNKVCSISPCATNAHRKILESYPYDVSSTFGKYGVDCSNDYQDKGRTYVAECTRSYVPRCPGCSQRGSKYNYVIRGKRWSDNKLYQSYPKYYYELKGYDKNIYSHNVLEPNYSNVYLLPNSDFDTSTYKDQNKIYKESTPTKNSGYVISNDNCCNNPVKNCNCRQTYCNTNDYTNQKHYTSVPYISSQQKYLTYTPKKYIK